MSGINRDLIQKKLAQLQASSNRNNLLWKPEPGKNTIRIVPYQHQSDYPFLELYFYYDLGNKTFLSNQTFGEADPIVEFCEDLKATGIKEDWQLSRKLEPKMRTYVPIIVRGKEKEGVKFWGFGKEIYQELLSITADPDYGDITDLKAGRDADVVYLTPKEAGNQYGSTKVRVKPNISEATDDPEVEKAVLEDQPNIYDVFKKRSYDELKEALERWLDPEKFENEKSVTNERIEKARKANSTSEDEDNPPMGDNNPQTNETPDDLPFKVEEPTKDEEKKVTAPSSELDAESEFDKLFDN